MNKPQKVVVGFLTIAVLIIAMLFIISINKPHSYYVCSPSISSDIILYYGTTCPHCKIVEQFIQENNINSKLNITQKEVFENQTNANELIILGGNCKLPQNYIGAVPLLYDNNKAFIGDKDIIEFIKAKAGVA